MPRPNILLITADQLRYDAVSPSGNQFIHTPNLERLASTGISFSNGFTPCPICVPARASITTGNYPHFATGTARNSGYIHQDQPVLAHHYNAAGYGTYAIGKLHYVPYAKVGEERLVHGFQSVDLMESGRIVSQYMPDPPRGMEDYYDYLRDIGWEGYTRAHAIGNNDVHPAPSPLPAEHFVDSWIARNTINRLKEHRSSRSADPFLAWMSFPKPHSPYDPPEPYNRFYDPRAIPPPLGTPEMLETKSPYLRQRRTQYNWEHMSPQAVQVARAHYYGLITFQDYCIGQVLDYLEAEELRENTIIIYTADHGDLLGDFGCFFKSNFLNGSVRIPYLWSAPALLPSGETRSDLVGLQDILPTLANLTDAPLNDDVHGLDISDCLRGTAGSRRDVYVSECHDAPDQTIMATDGLWKYIYSEVNGFEELYDLENDPDELTNLARENPQQCAGWQKQIIQWCSETGRDTLTDGDTLVQTPVDLSNLEPSRSGPFGWRWY